MNKSWKTTVAGAVGAVGAYFSTLEGSWKVAGQILTGLATFLLGMFARDNDKTSEQVGAVTTSVPEKP